MLVGSKTCIDSVAGDSPGEAMETLNYRAPDRGFPIPEAERGLQTIHAEHFMDVPINLWESLPSNAHISDTNGTPSIKIDENLSSWEYVFNIFET